MSAQPDRKTSRLRFGRSTQPASCYFITTCTKDRAQVLTTVDNGAAVTCALQKLHSSGDIQLFAATIMPDHTHFLFRLGDRLRVGQVMGKFKTLSCSMGRASWHWQQDGFEHRVRYIESINDYGFYVFMNPYRAELCPLSTQWPWWICPEPTVFRFLNVLDRKQTVPAAWLGLCDQVALRIATKD